MEGDKIMIEHLPQAIASLNAAASIIKGLVEIRDFTKLNENLDAQDN